MTIATIKPEEPCSLEFDLDISGSNEEPSDIRFIIEAQTIDGEEVQDTFSIICRAIRTADSVKVYIPRLLNIFKAGIYRSRLEVILENRVFVPIEDSVTIAESIVVKPIKEMKKNDEIKIKASLNQILDEIKKPLETDPEPDWKSKGFDSFRNPFKKD